MLRLAYLTDVNTKLLYPLQGEPVFVNIYSPYQRRDRWGMQMTLAYLLPPTPNYPEYPYSIDLYFKGVNKRGGILC